MVVGKMDTKLVIVVRRDLNMRKGKLAAQVGHAVQAVVTRLGHEQDDVPHSWLHDGLSTKVVVGCENLTALALIERAADSVGLKTHVVEDAGKTEFRGEPTITCLAVGPDEVSKVDAVTRTLELL